MSNHWYQSIKQFITSFFFHACTGWTVRETTTPPLVRIKRLHPLHTVLTYIPLHTLLPCLFRPTPEPLTSDTLTPSPPHPSSSHDTANFIVLDQILPSFSWSICPNYSLVHDSSLVPSHCCIFFSSNKVNWFFLNLYIQVTLIKCRKSYNFLHNCHLHDYFNPWILDCFGIFFAISHLAENVSYWSTASSYFYIRSSMFSTTMCQNSLYCKVESVLNLSS